MRAKNGRWLLLACAMVVLSSGCGRWPGPHDSEVGKLTWWLRVEGGSWSDEGCAPDGPHRRFGVTDTMPYLPGRAWYVNYEVLPGKQSAFGWSCDPEDWTQCVPVDDEIWTIDGHDVSIVLETSTTDLGDEACRVDTIFGSTLHDQGTKATFTDWRRFVFVGDAAACERVEASFRGAVPDGPGLRECVFTYDYPFVFSHVVKQDRPL